jgi:hypothetical protein
MAIKIRYWLLLFYSFLILLSCNQSKKILSASYYNNQEKLDSIQLTYNQLYAQTPFSLEFNDKPMNDLSIAIITDSIKYIYQFDITEKRMTDTLEKFNLNTAGVNYLITQMKYVRCTWINNLTYYEKEKMKTLTYISLRPVTPGFTFTDSRYFILTYFQQPQYFDSEGRLLAGKELRKLRQINNEIFKRINDKVCYTISKKFR